MTFGLVEPGEIIGTLARCASGAAASERDEATSPSSAFTWSRWISFCAAVRASSVTERSSSVTTTSGLPSTPPAALISSTAMRMPWSALRPKVAVSPVMDATWPTMMPSARDPALLFAAAEAEQK